MVELTEAQVSVLAVVWEYVEAEAYMKELSWEELLADDDEEE